MNRKQEKFQSILNKHCIENSSSFTSNEFHTIWNALEEYNLSKKKKDLKRTIKINIHSKKCKGKHAKKFLEWILKYCLISDQEEGTSSLCLDGKIQTIDDIYKEFLKATK